MPKKSATTTEPAVFSLDDYRPDAFDDHDVREIEMPNGQMLTVTLVHLTTRQARKIKTDNRTPLETSYKACARYVIDWNLTARNQTTGETITLPAPGSDEATTMVGEGNEWELMEMLDNTIGSQIVIWLTNPAGMQLATDMGKKRSTPSKDGDTPSPDDETGTT